MTSHVQSSEKNASGSRRQYATFYIGDLFFGIEVMKVQEVLRYLDMTRVPLAPTVIAGLINLRGQIVIAIDLRNRLGLASRPEGELPMNMVVRTDDSAVSLLVDEIGDVLDVTDDTWEQPPDNMHKARRELIEGVHKLPGQLLLVLSTERVLQTSFCN